MKVTAIENFLFRLLMRQDSWTDWNRKRWILAGTILGHCGLYRKQLTKMKIVFLVTTCTWNKWQHCKSWRSCVWFFFMINMQVVQCGFFSVKKKLYINCNRKKSVPRFANTFINKNQSSFLLSTISRDTTLVTRTSSKSLPLSFKLPLIRHYMIFIIIISGQGSCYLLAFFHTQTSIEIRAQASVSPLKMLLSRITSPGGYLIF